MKFISRIFVSVTFIVSAATLPLTIASATSKVSLVDCLQMTSKPRVLIIACGDGNRYIADIQWTNWGSSTATATGLLTWNDCTPTCGTGHTHHVGLHFRASKIVRYRGQQVYSELIGPKGSWTTSSTVWNLLPQ